jgi:hypothetical protein
MNAKSVILFYSTNCAIWAKNELIKADISRELIPVPKDLSSDCGYSVRIDTADSAKVEHLLKLKGVEYDRIVEI